MTEYDHVTDDIEAVVEDTELPRRLRRRVYDSIEDREGVTTEQADEIARAAEAEYLDARIEPLEPAGTVSAQSIGEPGTQMSVPSDERIVVRRDGETAVTEIGPLVDTLMATDDREVRAIDDHEVARAPGEFEVLSLRDDEQVCWKPVEEISRHSAPDELLQFTLESGRQIRATKAHSFVVKDGDSIVPIDSAELDIGDELPVIGVFDQSSGQAKIPNLDERTLTDGGAAVARSKPTGQSVGTASWDRIDSIETVTPDDEYVYDVSVEGLETFTTASGVVTHNTMNTFHYAGVAEIDVTQGLPRLIELVDARKEPDTPMMTVYLDDEYAANREKAREVVWSLEATKILALGDVSTNVADMVVRIDLNEETLLERWPTIDAAGPIAEEIAETIEAALGVDTRHQGMVIEFGPSEPSYRELLQLVEELREIVFKGIEDISRVVIRKEEVDDGEKQRPSGNRTQSGDGEEFVLYTEGSAFGDVLRIDGVDASRSTCNNIHEIKAELGVEAAREAIINETIDTLREQGLDDVNVRHLMLVADIMTNEGTIESIGRHGISGSKDSVLARAAFEVTVNHLLDAAIHGESDDLNGIIENVISGKPVSVGTGDVQLRMGSMETSPADD